MNLIVARLIYRPSPPSVSLLSPPSHPARSSRRPLLLAPRSPPCPCLVRCHRRRRRGRPPPPPDPAAKDRRRGGQPQLPPGRSAPPPPISVPTPPQSRSFSRLLPRAAVRAAIAFPLTLWSGPSTPLPLHHGAGRRCLPPRPLPRPSSSDMALHFAYSLPPPPPPTKPSPLHAVATGALAEATASKSDLASRDVVNRQRPPQMKVPAQIWCVHFVCILVDRK
ncbi:hypothetical protein BS78_03G150600 [Paspalum vaginatum]|nr:hypothetical protein BS78_03G150600 [Paspalum vaginatum]